MINLKTTIKNVNHNKINKFKFSLFYQDFLSFLTVLILSLAALLNLVGSNHSWLITKESDYIIWIGLIIFSILFWYKLSWKTRKLFSNNILQQLPYINQMLKFRTYFFLLGTFYYLSKKEAILKEFKFIENNIISNNFIYNKDLKTLTIDILNFASVFLMMLGVSLSFSSYTNIENFDKLQPLTAFDISGFTIGFLGFALFWIMYLFTCYNILKSKNKWFVKLIFMIPFIHLFSFYVILCPNYEFPNKQEKNINIAK